MLLCGVPELALDMVHALLWLWLLMDSTTTTGFRSYGTVPFDQDITYGGVTLEFWDVFTGGATLLLMLPDVWYLYQTGYCENGLNR